MSTGTEKSKPPLHNFTMPCDLRWGNQRFLRCMKVNNSSDHHRRTTTTTTAAAKIEREKNPSPHFPNGSSHKLGSTPPPPSESNGIAAVREKVMFDLQTAADKMKNAIFKDGLEKGEVPISASASASPSPPPAEAEAEAYRPWNLRTRRAACRTPVTNDGGVKGVKVDSSRPSSGFPEIRSPGATSAAAATEVEKSPKIERAKFSIALSKREIEDDFMGIVGHRPPRRPKKRAKIVQKQLDTLFPGLWLTEVTSDMYKVNEVAP